MKIHAPDCDCDRCKRLWAAMLAQWPDGSYVFTDEELEQLSVEEDVQ